MIFFKGIGVIAGRGLYTIVLVDDEDEARGRTASRISPQSGFTVVGCAGNGHDALELIDELSPHVVVTDIRMPYIDGLELARIIKQQHPSVRVAFITGYDEFDYAREAITLGVKSYLTKPLTGADIAGFLANLKDELDQEFRRNADREELEAKYSASLPLIIDSCFSWFLSSAAGGGREVQSLQNHGIDLCGKSGFLALIRVEESAGPGEGRAAEGGPEKNAEESSDVFLREKKTLMLRTVLGKILTRRQCEFHQFLRNENLVVLLLNIGGPDLDEALLEIVQTAEIYHETGITIGVSTPFEGFAGVRKAYMEARGALNDSMFLNIGPICRCARREKPRQPSMVMSESETRAMEYAVRFGSDRQFEEAVDAEIRRIEESAGSVSSYRLYMINLANIVIGFSAVLGVELTELHGGDILDTAARFSSPGPMLEWFRSVIGMLRRANRQNRLSGAARMLESAVAYIKSHYTDPELNMERTCENVGISVSYLSLLFKKNTGRSFVKYLTEIRLEKARELLKYSGERIITIAEKCGYNDVYYFSHSFKKYTGVSPKTYRENQTTA